jgi:hypothetical protein
LNGERLHLQDWWVEEQLRIHGTQAAVCRIHGIPPRTFRRSVARYRKNKGLMPVALDAAASMAAMEERFPVAPMAEELVITGDGVVSSDWHVPLTSFENAAKLIQSAVEHGLTDWLAIVGDFFNLDAMGRWDDKQESAGLGIEIRIAGQILELLLDVFDVIYVTKGNHDERLLDKLAYKIKFEQSIRMLLPNISDEKMRRIVVTEYDFIRIETNNGPWHCAHTRQYSKIPLSVPRELCDIYGMHVAAAHRHHHGITTSKGGFLAVELGGLFDARKTHYLKKYTNTFPRWTPGWMLLRDGFPYLPLLAPVP